MPKTITWAEFKAAVEAAGVQDADEIAWIDWSAPSSGVTVERYDDESVKVTDARTEDGQ